MLEARKSSWFERGFGWYCDRFLIRRQFHSVWVKGEVDPKLDRPRLYIMNHSSWWDGLLAFAITRRHSRLHHYMMMEEAQLRRFSFFRRIGAYSIDKSSRSGILDALSYTVRLLGQADTGVWLFPQGDIRHPDIRPLGFGSGVGYLLQRCPDAVVIPVTTLITYSDHPKAAVTIRFGDPMDNDWSQLSRQDITHRCELFLTRQLDEQKRLLTEGAAVHEAYTLLYPPRLSIHEIYDLLKKGGNPWSSSS